MGAHPYLGGMQWEHSIGSRIGIAHQALVLPASAAPVYCQKTSGKAAMKHVLVAVSLIGLYAPAAPAQWQVQMSGTDADLRGLSVVSARCAWVSGTRGTCARTIDGGK